MVLVGSASLPRRAILSVAVGVVLSGCAAKPPEKPIVLRRPVAERRATPSPVARKPATSVVSEPSSTTSTADAAPFCRPVTGTAPSCPPAPTVAGADPTQPLTPDQKQRLFQDFDRYLARPAP